MMEVLGPPLKNSICFYSRVANGYSGWLTKEDILYLMHYILSYDTISVEEWSNLYREGIEWYGLRLKATKEVHTKQLRYLDGKKRMIPVTEYKDADTIYHFKDKELRDSVKEYWDKNIRKKIEASV
jgi:hypothetical protein